jgi:hypothetical protein
MRKSATTERATPSPSRRGESESAEEVKTIPTEARVRQACILRYREGGEIQGGGGGGGAVSVPWHRINSVLEMGGKGADGRKYGRRGERGAKHV